MNNKFCSDKKFNFIMILVMTALTLGGCDQNKRMMFGTGGTAGTYYSYGGVLAQYIHNNADIKVTAVSTGGSKVNVQSIQDGDFQLGFVQSDVMAYAWSGTKTFEKDGPTHDFRVLGGLYAETVQLITMDENIKSVEDLRGKSVSIGAAGSGVYFNAIDVLSAADISLDDIKPQYQSFEDSKEALKDGKISAAFIVAGAPTTAITELATTNGVYFINIDSYFRDGILKDCPYYTAQQIPAGTYPKQDEPVETISVKATIVVSAKLEEELSELDDEEKAMFMEELGINESGLDRLIKASYALLGLISFLTDGKKECRAWTIKKGTKAPQAAGKIHSDFERGFIRAQVMAYSDLEEAGFDYQAVKAKGKQRTEGKEYVVEDGDIIEFLFNV